MIKQVIAVRTDLGMSVGKTSAQVAHASLNAADRAEDELLNKWKDAGAPKIIVKVSSEAELRDLAEDAENRNLPHSVTMDQGRTELEPGTATTFGIGPAPNADIDEVTGDLSLL